MSYSFFLLMYSGNGNNILFVLFFNAIFLMKMVLNFVQWEKIETLKDIRSSTARNYNTLYILRIIHCTF